MSVGAILAVLRIAYAGYLYMGSDMWSKKEDAREMLGDAIIGLLLLFAIYLVLNQINPCLLNLNVLQDIPAANSTGASSAAGPSCGGNSSTAQTAQTTSSNSTTNANGQFNATGGLPAGTPCSSGSILNGVIGAGGACVSGGSQSTVIQFEVSSPIAGRVCGIDPANQLYDCNSQNTLVNCPSLNLQNCQQY